MCVCVLTTSSSAWARALTVSTLADDCSAPPSGSLRAAIDAANATGGPAVITYAPDLAGTIVLACPLSISAVVDINAKEDVEVDGYLLTGHDILTIQPPAAVRLDRFRLRGGTETRAIKVESGAVLEVDRSEIGNNEWPDGGTTGGAGMWVESGSTVAITRSLFYTNVVPDCLDCLGGAILVEGPSDFYVSDTEFEQNYAQSGGAIAFLGDFPPGSAAIEGSTFFNNLVFSSSLQGGRGGALWAEGNAAGRAAITVLNSTFAKNGANEGGAAGVGSAAGLVRGAEWVFRHCTFVGNFSWPSLINTEAESVVNDSDSVIVILNSILTLPNADRTFVSPTSLRFCRDAQNPLPFSTPGDWGGGSNHRDLLFDPGGPQPEDCPGVSFTSLVSSDPLLASLDFNGGDTRTHAVDPGSPVVGAAAPSLCPPEDQRGFPRNPSACWIGSYED